MFTLTTHQLGRIVLAYVAAGGGIACAAAHGGSSAHDAKPAVRREPIPANAGQVLSDARLNTLQVGAGSAYDVIDRLRPVLLERGSRIDPVSASAVTIWLEGQRLDSPEPLKEMPAYAIRQIHYLTPGQARFYFGPMHEGAVVLLSVGRQ